MNSPRLNLEERLLFCLALIMNRLEWTENPLFSLSAEIEPATLSAEFQVGAFDVFDPFWAKEQS